MQPEPQEVTEKRLAEDFEQINDEIQKKLRELQIEQAAPLGTPADDEGLVVEPVYAFDVHASS